MSKREEEVTGLSAALARSDYATAVQLCEEAELENGAGPTSPHAALRIVLHLLLNNSSTARHAALRADSDAKDRNRELRAACQLCSTIRRRDFGQFFAAAQHTAWSTMLSPLVAALTDQVRERHARTLARAYAKIDRETVQAQLGFADAAEAVAYCVARGWAHTGGILEPPSSLPPAASEAQLAGPSQVDKLAQYVVHLEQAAITDPAPTHLV